MYFVIQIVSLFLAILSLSQASAKTATKFDKITYGLYSLAFMILATVIEGVLKPCL